MCTACTVIGLAEQWKYLGTLTYLHSKLDELHEFSEFGALVGLETGLLQIEPSLAHLQRGWKREGVKWRKQEGGGGVGGGKEKTSGGGELGGGGGGGGGGEDRSGGKGKKEGGKEVRMVHRAGGRTEEDEWIKKDLVHAVLNHGYM